MKSSVCLSVLVAFKITKVDTSCIITCDSGPYCSNFITCIRIYNAKKKKMMITRNIDSKRSLTLLQAGLNTVSSTFFPSSTERCNKQ